MRNFLLILGILLVVALAFLNPVIAVAAAAGGAVLWKRK